MDVPLSDLKHFSTHVSTVMIVGQTKFHFHFELSCQITKTLTCVLLKKRITIHSIKVVVYTIIRQNFFDMFIALIENFILKIKVVN